MLASCTAVFFFTAIARAEVEMLMAILLVLYEFDDELSMGSRRVAPSVDTVAVFNAGLGGMKVQILGKASHDHGRQCEG